MRSSCHLDHTDCLSRPFVRRTDNPLGFHFFSRNQSVFTRHFCRRLTRYEFLRHHSLVPQNHDPEYPTTGDSRHIDFNRLSSPVLAAKKSFFSTTLNSAALILAMDNSASDQQPKAASVRRESVGSHNSQTAKEYEHS